MNRVAWFIARKYLFSKKSHSVINLISIVSIVAVAIPAAAMVILLSVSNGFGDFIKQLNSTFDPDIEIAIDKGQYFNSSEQFIDRIRDLAGVEYVSCYIDGNSVVMVGDRSKVVTIRGIDSVYKEVFPINTAISDGAFNKYQMLMGSGVAYALNYGLGVSGEVSAYAPNPHRGSFFGVSQYFVVDNISVSGVFVLDTQTDSRYVIAPIGFTENLLSKQGKVSAVGIRLSKNANMQRVLAQVKTLLPEGFVAKDSFQQREFDYMIVKQEKMAIYIMLFFVLLIASLILVGTVIMMMVEKRGQIETLRTLGARESLIKSIFRCQSIMLTMLGSVVGVVLGVAFVCIQEVFGVITINSDLALIDHYPVKLEFLDLVFVVFATLSVGVIISIVTTKTAISNNN